MKLPVQDSVCTGADPRSALWSRAANILCIRLDSLGDVLMCTPAMRAVKESSPGRRITLLTSASGAATVPWIPEVDEAIAFSAPWTNAKDPGTEAFDLALIARLRELRFDAAVVFTTYSQSALPAALLCRLAGIPLRLAHCRENPYGLLSDWVAETEPQGQVRHEVRRQLDLVGTIGCSTWNERLSFAVPQRDLDWAYRRILARGIDPHGAWIVVHPGASAPSRRYPVSHWTRVVQELTQDLGCAVLLTGNADEAELIETIRQGSGAGRAGGSGAGAIACSFAGELSLGRLGAFIRLADLVICNNTGPAHMAAAVGTPIVDLYALTNPQHTPWKVANRVLYHDVSCRFCYKSVCPEGHHHCLALVEPDTVLKAARELLRSAAGVGEGTDDGCVPARRLVRDAEMQRKSYLPI